MSRHDAAIFVFFKNRTCMVQCMPNTPISRNTVYLVGYWDKKMIVRILIMLMKNMLDK